MPMSATTHDRWLKTQELKIAEEMEELCKDDGEHMEMILGDETFSVVDLENSFSRAAYAICHQRDFYRRNGSQLAQAFSPEQRRILAYLLWLPKLADRKRRRMMLATASLHSKLLLRAEQEYNANEQ